MLAHGARVVATTRTPARLAALADAGAMIYRLDMADPDTLAGLAAFAPPGVRVLHSLPAIDGADPTSRLLAALPRPARIVLISTTGVYGDVRFVDERTPYTPPTPRIRPRIEAENAVLGSGVSALVLRPAGIYGPGKGVQSAIRAGRYVLAGDGSNWLSRIHVDDLATHCEAALLSDLTGAYPVADTEPAPARAVAAFCANLLGLPMPPSLPLDPVHGRCGRIGGWTGGPCVPRSASASATRRTKRASPPLSPPSLCYDLGEFSTESHRGRT